VPGEDIDVAPAWSACGTGHTCRGEGIRVAIVDDGLDIHHEDLAANVATGLSKNYGDDARRDDPSGGGHGTSVAGVVAARDFNNVGGRGVSPRANLVGYNLLAPGNSTIGNEVDAALRGWADVDISNNSWGPPDGNGTLDPSSPLWQSAIAAGLAKGRHGRGTIYVWAAGNGASDDGCPGCVVDNSNYDGYANHRGVIAVCAVGDDGKRARYSEKGANLLVCAPSSGNNGHGITTTASAGKDSSDPGSGGTGTVPTPSQYTSNFGGTSAATPTVAGVVALMLQANPSLGWRDVRWILAQSARQNDKSDPDWVENSAIPVHYLVNHSYGFGVVDAAEAVALARSWTNVGPELSYTTAVESPNLPIPDNDPTGRSSAITISNSPLNRIELIEVTFTASDHPKPGDLEITLQGPGTTRTESKLAEAHTAIKSAAPYDHWVFTTTRHLGEAVDGTWVLTVKDKSPGGTGTFQSWQLKFYGYSATTP
jgi:kexin